MSQILIKQIKIATNPVNTGKNTKLSVLVWFVTTEPSRYRLSTRLGSPKAIKT